MEIFPFTEIGGGRALECPLLAGDGGFAHCFTTRRGGASAGVFSSLNMSASRGDDISAVKENYRRAAEAAGLSARFAFTAQVHGSRILTACKNHARSPEEAGLAPECDGLSTGEQNLPLVGMFADCVPILLADPVRRACAVIHAGWRGTAAGIAAKAVAHMEREHGSRPKDLTAAIGPSIASCCFLCHEDVVLPMRVLGSFAGSCITPADDGRYSVDLKMINGELLRQSGVRRVFISSDCTCCDPEGRFFSHRRDGAARGGMAAIIEII